MKKFIIFLVSAAFAFGSFLFCFLGFYNHMVEKNFYNLGGFIGIMVPFIFSGLVAVFSYFGLHEMLTPKKKDKEDETSES